MSPGRAAVAAAAGLAAAGGAGTAGAAAPAQAACLLYEPAQVVLVGRLQVQEAAPGAPPRFGLRLDKPVCLTPGSGAPAATGVREVELAFPRGGALPRDRGRRIAVSGSLFRVEQGRRAHLKLNVTGLGRVR